jgi:hypothetical protein
MPGLEISPIDLGRWRSFLLTAIHSRPLQVSLGVLVAVLCVIAIVSWGNTITPAGIVIHHSGYIGGPVQRATLDTFHERQGKGVFYWGSVYHIGYHYLIKPDGRIQVGRPEKCVGAHTKERNMFLGIVLVGNFSRKDNPKGTRGMRQPTVAQMNSLADLVQELQAKYRITPKNVILHRQVRATECPGDRFTDDFLQQLRQNAVAVR